MSWRKGIEIDVSVAPDRSYLTRHDDWNTQLAVTPYGYRKILRNAGEDWHEEDAYRGILLTVYCQFQEKTECPVPHQEFPFHLDTVYAFYE